MAHNATWIDEEFFDDYLYNYSYTSFTDWPDENRSYRLALIWLEVILGVILNSLTIFVLYRGTHIDKSLRIFLLNVSVSDLLFCCAVLFYEHVINAYKHIPNIELCRFILLVTNGIADSTMMWRMTLGIVQFITINSDGRINWTKKKKIIISISTWAASCLLTIYYIITAMVHHWTNPDGSTQSGCHMAAYGVGFTVTAFSAILPVIVMFVMHALIGWKLYSNSANIRSQFQQTGVQVKQTSMMLMADGWIFALTWLPVQLLNVMMSLGFYTDLLFDRWFHIFTILHIILCIKCFDTPIIYFVTSSSFRADVKALFYGCKPIRLRTDVSTDDVLALVETEMT